MKIQKKLLFLAALTLSSHSFANALYYQTVPKFESTEHGKLLTGAKGLALYTFKKDVNVPIPPKCTSKQDKGALGSCLARWPAATITLKQMPKLITSDPMFGAVYNNELKRLQLTYGGLPVYYWYKDTAKKNFTGDGVGKAWALIEKGQAPIKFDGMMMHDKKMKDDMKKDMNNM